MGAGEMAKRLGALAALSAVLNSVSSKHMVAHRHLYWDLMPSSVIKSYMQTEHLCRLSLSIRKLTLCKVITS